MSAKFEKKETFDVNEFKGHPNVLYSTVAHIHVVHCCKLLCYTKSVTTYDLCANTMFATKIRHISRALSIVVGKAQINGAFVD